MLFSNSVDS